MIGTSYSVAVRHHNCRSCFLLLYMWQCPPHWHKAVNFMAAFLQLHRPLHPFLEPQRSISVDGEVLASDGAVHMVPSPGGRPIPSLQGTAGQALAPTVATLVHSSWYAAPWPLRSGEWHSWLFLSSRTITLVEFRPCSAYCWCRLRAGWWTVPTEPRPHRLFVLVLWTEWGKLLL